MIDNSIIQEIKERLDIVEVVSDFISLKKSGSNYKALSPFTSEKTPSFFVSPSKQIFKCFSTGKGGDAIEFLREVDSMTYIEAIKYLGEKYGVEINEYEIDNSVSSDDLPTIIDQVLNDNSKALEDAKNDPQAIHFLIGQVMKATKGRANHEDVKNLIEKKLSE